MSDKFMTEEQYKHLEDQYWDAYIIRLRELELEQADTFDETSEETTRKCRRAGIRRMADDLAYSALKDLKQSLQGSVICCRSNPDRRWIEIDFRKLEEAQALHSLLIELRKHG